MSVTITTEEELRKLSYEKPYLAVKYHNDNNPVCQELYRKYEAFSNEDKYSKIFFIRINFNENQIAKRLIEKDVYSFMAIYKNGLLIESRTISDEEDIKLLLNKLASMIE